MYKYIRPSCCNHFELTACVVGVIGVGTDTAAEPFFGLDVLFFRVSATGASVVVVTAGASSVDSVVVFMMFSLVRRISASDGSGRCKHIARFILLLSNVQFERPTMAIDGSISI